MAGRCISTALLVADVVEALTSDVAVRVELARFGCGAGFAECGAERNIASSVLKQDEIVSFTPRSPCSKDVGDGSLDGSTSKLRAADCFVGVDLTISSYTSAEGQRSKQA